MKYSLPFSRSEFFQEYWQQNVLVSRGSFNFNPGSISADELAGLSCEEDIDSRLIISNPEQTAWSCEHGPFDEERFTQLDENNWTLLVQNVDAYIPEIAELKEAFDFIPKWRLDDVMLSYATSGGGVGPHFDYYDVFLIQLSGSREWKIGQACKSDTPLRDHPDLKLLNSFSESETHILNPGDMIYIPAGVAHWGTATSDNCITASVGFRAPAHRELLQAAIGSISERFTDDQRYFDSSPDHTEDVYLIDDSVKDQLTMIWNNLDKNSFIESLTEEFSVQVTEPRNEDLFELYDYSLDELSLNELIHHPASRFAYRHTDTGVSLYANGISYPTNLQTALAICHSDYSDPETIDLNLILELSNEGLLIKT